MSRHKKRKPLMHEFGYINLDSWIAYNAEDQTVLISDNKCTLCNQSDHPHLFVDLEMVRDPKTKAYRGLQIHLALSGVRVHKQESKRKLYKSRVDAYLSKDSAKALYGSLQIVLKELGLLE